MRKTILIALLLLICSCSEASFIPEEPIMPISELKPGMNGYMLTVMQGLDPSRIPVKIVSVIPSKPGKDITHEILIKFTDGTRLAQGMSGAPIYVQGKLIGAIRSGWDFSDHTMAMIAPIEDMCRVFDYPNKETPKPTFPLADMTISGLNISTPAMKHLADTLGVTFTQGISSGNAQVTGAALKPGDSVTALFVWGDIEMGAVGTVTATSKQGRFLAFGHKVFKRGAVAYPAAKTYIHGIVNSATFPFKLAEARDFAGTFLQDREAGLGGRQRYFVAPISAVMTFRDLDTGTEKSYRFCVTPDEFMSPELLTSTYTALAEEAWGRKGQGTMSVNLRIDGKNIPNGWARRDIFFAEDDITAKAFEQTKAIISAYLTQPYEDIMPAGFTLTVEASQKPRILMIENVEAPEDAYPGQEVNIRVKLRGWRKDPTEYDFTMKIPEDASEGVCELIVRGGGIESMRQISVEEGYKSIDGLDRMLTEFKARDANNELILELNIDRSAEALKRILAQRRNKNVKALQEPDLLPEEEEYISETKVRRINEGSLKIFRSEYFIDGMMKRIIHVHNDRRH